MVVYLYGLQIVSCDIRTDRCRGQCLDLHAKLQEGLLGHKSGLPGPTKKSAGREFFYIFSMIFRK
jgi:hypothetical protein